MAVYAIGRTIRAAREKAGLSQQALCEGICSLPTLSKIENGVQNPSRKTLQYISERLGIDLGLFNVPVSDVEAQKQAIEEEIFSYITEEKYNYETLLLRYKKLGLDLDSENQFYIFAKAFYDLHHGLPEKDSLQEFIRALSFTRPNFVLEKQIASVFMTYVEQLILNQIAWLSYKTGNQEFALRIYIELKSFYEKEAFNEIKLKIYPLILYNISTIVGRQERYEYMVELCIEGIEYCKENGKLTVFPYLLFNKGYGLAKLKRHTEAKVSLGWAFSLFEALDKAELAAWLSVDCNEKFSYDFPINVELLPERRKLFLTN